MANKSLDLTGRHFGKLMALQPITLKGSVRRWYCICECGKTKLTPTCALVSGNTKSCGCSGRGRKASDLSRGKTLTEYHRVYSRIKLGWSREKAENTPVHDPSELIGQRFGFLTVISRDSRREGNRNNTRWLCSCDCGREHSVLRICLKQGLTKSCGKCGLVKRGRRKEA